LGNFKLPESVEPKAAAPLALPYNAAGEHKT